MSSQSDAKKRVEQFYRLLSDYGLTGKTQPLNLRDSAKMDQLFPDEEE